MALLQRSNPNMTKQVPCKNFYCPNTQAESYLYCEDHNDCKEEIDDVEYAAKHCERKFNEAEDYFVMEVWGKDHPEEARYTLVNPDYWDWAIEEIADDWGVHATAVENRLKTRLFEAGWGKILVDDR